MAPKAIETRYAGCRFRSRLEARWAVFMDHLGVKWEYEPQGFELPSGRYLPDFWLPQVAVWMEIKGQAPTQKEARKLTELAYEECGKGHRARLLYGDIPREIQIGVPCLVPVPDPDTHLSAGWGSKISDYTRFPVDDWCLLRTLWVTDRPEKVNRALTAARSARFEFGESG